MASYIGKSGTFALMKNLNLEKVYRTIVLEAPISRAEISRLTGLNKVTVSNCVKDLLAADLVSEEGIISVENGRPPIMLVLSASFGVMIGVEVSGISTNAIVTDLQGNVLESRVGNLGVKSPEAFISDLKTLVEECKVKYADKIHGIVGLSVALPLNYNQNEGEEKDPPLPGWLGVDAEALLHETFTEFPVYVLTTSAAGAIGEVHFGGVVGTSTFLAYLHGAWSIKLDIYKGGETLSEQGIMYGRFGHTVFRADDYESGDTRKGYIEYYASLRSAFNKIMPEENDRYLGIHEIAEKLDAEDPETDKVMRELVHELSYAMFNVIQLFRPEKICIGSYLGNAISHNGYLQMLRDRVTEMTHGTYDTENIYCSKLGLHGVAYGCISRLRDDMVSLCFE